MSLTNLGDGTPEAVWFGYIEVALVEGGWSAVGKKRRAQSELTANE